jgi:hypothetical protein
MSESHGSDSPTTYNSGKRLGGPSGNFELQVEVHHASDVIACRVTGSVTVQIHHTTVLPTRSPSQFNLKFTEGDCPGQCTVTDSDSESESEFAAASDSAESESNSH